MASRWCCPALSVCAAAWRAPQPGLLVAIHDTLTQLQVPVVADVQLRAQLRQHELRVLHASTMGLWLSVSCPEPS